MTKRFRRMRSSSLPASVQMVTHLESRSEMYRSPLFKPRRTDARMLTSWMMLAAEANGVVALRSMKLMRGGNGAQREAERMVREKIDAALDATGESGDWCFGRTNSPSISKTCCGEREAGCSIRVEAAENCAESSLSRVTANRVQFGFVSLLMDTWGSFDALIETACSRRSAAPV